MPGESEPPARRPRGSLSRSLIIDAAYEIAARDGLTALSMPKLASQLGTSPMSLYRHFRDKDELLDELAAMALADQYADHPIPDSSEHWQDWVRSELRLSRRFILDHPGLGQLLLLRDQRRLASITLDRLNARLDMLMRAGFSAEAAARFWIALRAYTRGFALWETARSQEYSTSLRQEMAFLEPDSFPALGLASGALSDSTGDVQFEFGLDLLIQGAAASLR